MPSHILFWKPRFCSLFFFLCLLAKKHYNKIDFCCLHSHSIVASVCLIFLPSLPVVWFFLIFEPFTFILDNCLLFLLCWSFVVHIGAIAGVWASSLVILCMFGPFDLLIFNWNWVWEAEGTRFCLISLGFALLHLKYYYSGDGFGCNHHCWSPLFADVHGLIKSSDAI